MKKGLQQYVPIAPHTHCPSLVGEIDLMKKGLRPTTPQTPVHPVLGEKVRPDEEGIATTSTSCNGYNYES